MTLVSLMTFTQAGQLEVERLELARVGVPLGVTASLRLSAGDRLVLRGPSGVGKSTLLRSIVGLETPLSGGVALDGRSPEEWTWPRFRRRVVYVHQKAALFKGTALDNLRRPFAYRTRDGGRFDPAYARELLSRLGLGDVGGRAASELSGGEQRRLAVARGIVVGPAFLLLDEPSSGLDPETSERLAAVLLDACGQGLGVAVVSHDPLFTQAMRPTASLELRVA